MSFQAAIEAFIGWCWKEGVLDNSRLRYAANLPKGRASGQADACWHVEDQALASGEVNDWDLTNLNRTVLGDTLTIEFATIKAVHIVVTSTSGGTLEVGNCPVDPWSKPWGADSHINRIPPGSNLLMSNRLAGWDVTGLGASSSSSSSGAGGGDFSTADRFLRLRAAGGALTYSIAILGVRAVSPEASSSSSSGS